jgi:hypothetical protein
MAFSLSQKWLFSLEMANSKTTTLNLRAKQVRLSLLEIVSQTSQSTTHMVSNYLEIKAKVFVRTKLF